MTDTKTPLDLARLDTKHVRGCSITNNFLKPSAQRCNCGLPDLLAEVRRLREEVAAERVARERAEAVAAVHGGGWCRQNRAEGRDRCGACALCFSEEKARAERAEADAEQLRVQLAGCSVAALSPRLRAKPGDYGHSASHDDVARTVDAALARAERAEAALAETLRDFSKELESGVMEGVVHVKERLMDWARKSPCVYCDTTVEELGPDKPKEERAVAYREHTKVCPGHPMREVEARAEKAEATAREATAALMECEARHAKK